MSEEGAYSCCVTEESKDMLKTLQGHVKDAVNLNKRYISNGRQTKHLSTGIYYILFT